LGGGLEKQGFDSDREEIEGSHPFDSGQNGSTGWMGKVEAIDSFPPEDIRFEVWVVCAKPNIVFNSPGPPD
jgi:hypothetical protein